MTNEKLVCPGRRRHRHDIHSPGACCRSYLFCRFLNLYLIVSLSHVIYIVYAYTMHQFKALYRLFAYPTFISLSLCFSISFCLTPGPPCSLLTSCSSWSCCYLKPRLVARVETRARSTMAGCRTRLPLCQIHRLFPPWSPVWFRPSRASSWAGWASSHGPTPGLERRCPGTSWTFTASTSSSTI